MFFANFVLEKYSVFDIYRISYKKRLTFYQILFMEMKKTILVFLGLVYFLVIQLIVWAYVWDITSLYWLAILNFLVLVVLGVAWIGKIESSSRTHSSSRKIIKQCKKQVVRFFHKYGFVLVMVLLFLAVIEAVFIKRSIISVWWFVWVFFVLFMIFAKDLFRRKIYFGKRLFLPKDVLFGISMIVVLGIFAALNIASILLVTKIFWAVLVGFGAFAAGIWIFRAIGAYSIWKLISTRIYILIIGLSFVVSVVQFYFVMSQNQLITDSSQRRNFAWEQVVNNIEHIKCHLQWIPYSGQVNQTWLFVFSDMEYDSGFLLTGAGTVLDDSLVNTGDLYFESTGAVITNYEWAGVDLILNSWSVSIGDTEESLVENQEEIVEDDKEVFGLRNVGQYWEDDALEYADVLVYLLDIYDVDLTQKQTVRFTYVPFAHLDYAYFATAYQKRLIWNKIGPDTLVKCDNYLVMKGILAGWNVDMYAGDIFERYFAKAKDVGELNGCELGMYVTKVSL